MINNSDAFRALKGNYVHKKVDTHNVEMEKKCSLYLGLMG